MPENESSQHEQADEQHVESTSQSESDKTRKQEAAKRFFDHLLTELKRFRHESLPVPPPKQSSPTESAEYYKKLAPIIKSGWSTLTTTSEEHPVIQAGTVAMQFASYFPEFAVLFKWESHLIGSKHTYTLTWHEEGLKILSNR